MLTFIKRMLHKSAPRYVYARVDYGCSKPDICIFKVNVIRGMIGVPFLFNRLMLRLEPDGKTTIADKTCPGFGHDYSYVVTWTETAPEGFNIKEIHWEGKPEYI